MKLIAKRVTDAIGKYANGTVVVVISLEGVGSLGREAPAPVVTDEKFVGRVEIIAVARI